MKHIGIGEKQTEKQMDSDERIFFIIICQYMFSSNCKDLE